MMQARWLSRYAGIVCSQDWQKRPKHASAYVGGKESVGEESVQQEMNTNCIPGFFKQGSQRLTCIDHCSVLSDIFPSSASACLQGQPCVGSSGTSA